MYYLLLPGLDQRTAFIERLKTRGIHTVFHYVPLHSSPLGEAMGRAAGDMKHTDNIGERLVRLPLWMELEEHLPEVIAEAVAAADR